MKIDWKKRSKRDGSPACDTALAIGDPCRTAILTSAPFLLVSIESFLADFEIAPMSHLDDATRAVLSPDWAPFFGFAGASLAMICCCMSTSLSFAKMTVYLNSN